MIGRPSSIHDKNLVIELLKSKKYSYQHIAEIVGVTKNAVANFAVKNGFGIGNKLKIKHKHLRYRVLVFFKNHTEDECLKKFNLTKKNFKSLMTTAYKDEKYKHLRKDVRTKDPLTEKELIKMVQLAGLLPRDQIAKMLNRGSKFHAIKDRFKNQLNCRTKKLHGFTYHEVKDAFDCPLKYLRTKAGPTKFKLTIVPWVYLEEKINYCNRNNDFKKLICSLAKFQRWIYDARTNKGCLGKIRRNLQYKESGQNTRKPNGTSDRQGGKCR